ncbi:MAG TPA: nuclear transport factor 2 family protein [Terriglobia bacterium]|nr:nuclear transport factor 2 family protein [Terriglobia bacterium]
MKQRRFLLMSLSVMLVFFSQVTARAADSGAAAQSVLKAEEERTKAQVDRNLSALDRLMGNELTYTHASGITQTKAEIMGELKSGTLVYKSLTDTGVKVHVYGRTAVLTGRSAMTVVHYGKTLHLSLLFLEVDVNRNGQWQMVAYQSTRAKP